MILARDGFEPTIEGLWAPLALLAALPHQKKVREKSKMVYCKIESLEVTIFCTAYQK
jgi:hypothetical protein